MSDVWLAHWLQRPGKRRRRELWEQGGQAGQVPEPWLQRARKLRKTWQERELQVLSLPDAQYPALLRGVCDPPMVLLCQGAPSAWQRPCLALVGSRAATAYGLATARRLARELAANDVCIVSGLARGIDAAAHRGALDAGGHTVAVLGSGHARLYPRGHEGLAARIVEQGGAVLSEHRPEQGPRPFLFPRRNRVVAGMCQAVLVVAAGARSGALITADWALLEGRPVMAVPGPIGSIDAGGVNRLIQQGAPLVRDAADVLARLQLPVRPAAAPPADQQLPALERALLALLGEGLLSSHQLIEQAPASVQKVLAALTRLELDGWVESYPGRYFCRRVPSVQAQDGEQHALEV